MAPLSAGKTRGPRDAFSCQRVLSVQPFSLQGLPYRKAVLEIHRSPISAYTFLWEARDLVRESFGGRP